MEIKEISTAALKEKIEADEELYLIDVREDEEVAEGMITQAVHIRMGDIPEKMDTLDKDKEYTFICRSGMRSMNVCRYLDEQGFKTVNVEGGMMAWEGETKPKN
ncbi:rhodanese-like domain-containing protein [Bacillus halotolerans]|uniref:Rhodanese-like domain-containing protein n=1 Tax=Bacillus halotolerans TaxID=260554 RepID=A0ABY7HXG5_9BACI|nr:rhodanese-like domain-containing protein [Bacillus halotolerans]MDG0766376.1 rhodanese-like domain-containing protein [Bacillus halotolerans]UUI83383.1 rhodanese-like domain-containing protein [Bacillus halotolerans]WAT20342.1 rhodanese-like domain-containing protein [Bacillus halotolerans]